VRGSFANLEFDGVADADLVKGPGLGDRPQKISRRHAQARGQLLQLGEARVAVAAERG